MFTRNQFDFRKQILVDNFFYQEHVVLCFVDQEGLVVRSCDEGNIATGVGWLIGRYTLVVGTVSVVAGNDDDTV